MATIDFINCAIGYRRRTVVTADKIAVGPGVTVLIGANGTGKSTLLRTVAAIRRPLSGQITVDGRNVGSMTRRRLARTLSFVYTEQSVSGALTVRELVEMGRYPHTGLLGHLSASDRAIVADAMSHVGIATKADAFLSRISDGERQKAMIARVLAQQTPVILLDEPTSYLDAASRLEILSLLRNLADSHNATILLSTHDTASALSVADNVLTIGPDGLLQIAPVDSPTLRPRLDAIFADRGIHFDPLSRDFVIGR